MCYIVSQQPPIKTRIATISDLPHIVYIINHSITTSTSDYRYDIIDITNLQSWYEERTKNNEPVLVATIDDRVVGYATYCQFRKRIGFQYSVEHSIYCHPDYQGQGIGSLLMKELILFAKKQNMHTIIACIDSKNTNSIVFHKKIGFQFVGQMKEIGYKFGEFLDMTLMQLMLNNN